jgi:hypothetical protein
LAGVSDASTLNDLLLPLGYKFFPVTQREALRHPTISPHPRFRDWLFTQRNVMPNGGRAV